MGNLNALAGTTFRYRLLIAAPTVADLIARAGGWLVDYGFAGWEIGAWIGESESRQPLEVLGVEPIDFQQWSCRDSAPDVLAFAPSLYHSDDRIRARVRQALRGETEVVAIGPTYPEDLRGRQPTRVEREYSGAAAAFKAVALSAAGGAAETLVDREVCHCWPPSRMVSAQHAMRRWSARDVAHRLPPTASMSGRRIGIRSV